MISRRCPVTFTWTKLRRLVPWRSLRKNPKETDEKGVYGFETARVLVRLNHVAGSIQPEAIFRVILRRPLRMTWV